MRYGTERKAETRIRVVVAAARALRREGIDGAGLIGLMREAGLTKGGFYAHFESKDALVAEAVTASLTASAAAMCACAEAAGARGGSPLAAIVEEYLSLEHVAARDLGCTLGALLADLTRGSDAVREAAAMGAAGLARVIADALPASLGDERLSRAKAVLGTMAGCLQLARLETHETARDAMLRAGKNAAYLIAGVASESG